MLAITLFELLGAITAGCGDGGTAATDGSGGTGGGGGMGPPPICNQGSRWTPGTQAFRDSTTQWVLDTIGAEGVRLAAIDFDGDGWPGGFTQTREVQGGHRHYGAQDDLTVHFGLAAACEAEVTVRWPDAALTTQTATLPAGYRFT